MHSTDNKQYIEFCVDEENYAIPISEIHEIIKMQEITEIPNSLAYVQGVINLRGKIVPVISLRSLFLLEPDEYGKTTRIIVVKHEQDAVGIIVDKVSKVTTFSGIQPPPDKISNINGSYFTGIGLTEEEGLVGILKLDEVLIGNN